MILALIICVLITLMKLVSWYKTMYKLLKLSGGTERIGQLPTNYRSVLFVHTEGVHEGENEARSHREVQRQPVTLELTGIHQAPERGNVEEALVYRKTVHRLISKVEELGAWRDVMEECWMTAEAPKKEEERKEEGMDYARGGNCYSLILRENVEQTGGGAEEVEWVIGGWRFKRGGANDQLGTVAHKLLTQNAVGAEHVS